MKELSPRQRELLEKIAQYLQDGVPPSAASLAAEFGLAGESSITPVLKALEKKGFLEITAGVRGRQRTLRLTPRARLQLSQPGLPVLGTIPAGPLREALEEPEFWAEKISDLLPWKQGDFLLRVSGDSMINAGILPDDLVLIRPDVQLRQNEIAAVAVGAEHEVTLKRVRANVRKGTVTLVPENPAYAEQSYLAKEVRILGAFRGLLRR